MIFLFLVFLDHFATLSRQTVGGSCRGSTDLMRSVNFGSYIDQHEKTEDGGAVLF